MGAKVLIGILVALALLSLWAGVAGWNLESDVEMSGHGYAAMAIGIVASLVVGIGLMTLVFYSSRKGYDDAVGHSSARNPEDPETTA
jgi:heme/copper-type cytochrome/quinol oxidase subunit 2